MTLKLLARSSPAQQQAAFAYLYPKLQDLVNQYVPYFFQEQVQQQLQSAATKQQIYEIMDGTIDAALNAPETTT